MRTIILSLLLAAGCLDEAPQLQQHTAVLTAEPIKPIAVDNGRADLFDSEAQVEPETCDTSTDCPNDELCNVQLHRCGVI